MRTLSSRQTFFLKVVWPLVWTLGLGGVTLSQFLAADGFGLTPDVRWGFLAAWLVGVAFAVPSLGFKRVRIDASKLYASNYLQEIEVPLAQIAAVEENLWLRTHPVTIRLERDTIFGDRLVFVPRAVLFRWWAPHPVVAELRAAAELARSEKRQA